VVDSTAESDARRDRLEGQVVSGMRWTLWLALVGIPFSYGTSALFARVGPDAIGTYGLLGVYISLVGTFFYVGGNAVTVRYVAEFEGTRRLSFVISYFAVVAVLIVPWLVMALAWPAGLHYLFGEVGGTRFQQVIVWLAPLYLLFLLVQSALRGMLDVAMAQLLMRGVSVISFFAYAALFVGSPALLKAHPPAVIWAVFIGLTTLATGLGVWRLITAHHWGRAIEGITFFLPSGFWKYVAGVQGSSALGFLATNLDALFILHSGGVSTLGKYVVVMTIVLAVALVPTFLLESFVPALMNTMAQRDPATSARLVEAYMRIIAPAALAVMALVVVLAGPLVSLLGAQYAPLQTAIRFLAPVAVLSAVSGLLSTILVVKRRPHVEAAIKAVRIAVFAGVFFLLWERYQLSGAVTAWAAGEIVYHVLVVTAVRREFEGGVTLRRTYAAAVIAVASCFAGVVLLAGGDGVRSLMPVAVALGAFVVVAGYTLQEISSLVLLIVTGRRSLMPAVAE
jgi:O-antigen/teichoic acid export membrane protein